MSELGVIIGPRKDNATPRGRTYVAIALLASLAASVPAFAAPEKVAGGIRFTYTDPNAAQVAWAGEYNGWNMTANPMTEESDGEWSVVLPLGAGEHQYKLVVDGQWIADPENPATAGEFGNSVVNVDAQGNLIAVAATSNTPYSPKIFVGGRTIGLYQAIRDDENDRFELDRPNLDIDLDFGIRISDLLRARFLTNINSESENVDFFRSRLNFDRGYLLFKQSQLEIFGYDNEAAGTWNDPLRLVGAIGIYDHDYGFDRQGFRVGTTKWDLNTELHYADNFAPGGTNFPGLGDDPVAQTLPGLVLVSANGGLQFQPGNRSLVRNTSVTDDNEDMFGARIRRDLLDGPESGRLTVGVLGRTDRGFNLTTLALARATGDSTLTTVNGNAQQLWYALGGEARWNTPWNTEIFAEYLRGELRYDMLGGSTRQNWRLATADTSGVAVNTVGPSDDASDESFTLDTSNRFKIGATWRESHGDVVLTGSVEFQDHAYELQNDGLDNSMTIWSLSWDRNWRYYLNREVKTGLAIEYTNFDYDPSTPWRQQLWFPTGNFWLEHDEHEVSVDRLTLLGGNDVVSIRPSFEIPIARPRNVLFRYQGTFNTVSLDVRPKYYENLFYFGFDITDPLRFNTDTRWAKYDDPVLELNDGYVSHFVELAYTFSPEIQVALSYGVDPWAIDPPVNEYAYIGRDLFLFERGADGATAETNFFGLGPRIADAEEALRDDRRIQVEAIVRF